MAEEPQTPYEKMLDSMGLDCSFHECWKPMIAVVLNKHREEIGVCREHAQPYVERGEILRWLES